LANGDEAALGYFPDGNNSPNLHKFSQGFVTDGSIYYPLIDSLKTGGFLGTPLYNASIQAINETDAKAVPTHRKAVIVFTDGQSVGDPATLKQVVAAAQAKHIQVHVVALGPDPDMKQLARLAQQTGGTTMHATNAAQLVSFYR